MKEHIVDIRNPLANMAQIVRLITRVGPDINRIARIMGEHKETIRYRYKEKILAKGMVIQAVPDEEALGLRRVAAKVRVAGVFLPHAQQMFWAMSDLCYAAAFELALPEEFYVLHASVPKELVAHFKSFVRQLNEMGFFESIDLYEFDRFRRIPMRAEYFDFDEGQWDYDWQQPLSIEKAEVATNTRGRVRFDKTDLLLLKELQIDANRSLLNVTKSLVAKNQSEINYKTLQWHYQHHVIVGELIQSYSIRWLGTAYDAKAEKAKQKRHRYLVVDMIVKDVNRQEVLELTTKAHQTPFLWSEMWGKDYLAQWAFPIEATMEAFDYLRQIMRPFAGRATYYVVDQKNAIQFVLPYKLWSDVERRWKLDMENVLARFENLILKIKSGADI